MGLVVLPHNPTGLRNGVDTQSGSVVLENDQALATVLNGQIDKANVSPTAGLPGTTLSNVGGERVPTDRIEDDAIDGTKLKDDPTTGHAGAAVNLSDHVKDGILNGLKLISNTVGADKLRIGWADYALGTVSPSTDNSHDMGVVASTSYPLGIAVLRAGDPAIVAEVAFQVGVNTSTDRYYAVFRNLTGFSVNLSGYTLRFYYLTIASS